MGGNKNWFAVVELIVVLLVTAAAFALGKQAALAERGYTAYGGECCSILIPAIYYIGKSMR